MPLVCSGSMPHVSPFHLGLPHTSAYCHTSPIATSHSTSDDTWMAHVGMDSAFAGSSCTTNAAAEPCGSRSGITARS
jgi:hypothetical protein